MGPFLGAPGLSNVLLAGVLTGFLPCGLVYGFLTLSSSSASVVHGLCIMVAFGAGDCAGDDPDRGGRIISLAFGATVICSASPRSAFF